MQRKFTSRDIVQFSLLTGILVMILVAMYMVDRQWLRMTEMQAVMAEQSKDMRSLRSLVRTLDQRLRDGVIAHNEASSKPNILPAFERAHNAAQQANHDEGDWLLRSFGNSIKTLTPLVSKDVYASNVQNYVIETLLSRDPQTLEYHGLLAESWQVSDDGLTYNFKLRQDVNFSDGEPFDADDVVFSYEFIMNERVDAPQLRAYYNKIISVEASHKYEVVFTFSEPYFNSLNLVGALPILPEHFYRPYSEDPEAFNQSKGLLLGTGPYRLTDPINWTPDVGSIELERNPRYWGPVSPSFDRIIWKVIQNDSARLTTFRNGDIDSYEVSQPREYKELLQDTDFVARNHKFEYMSPIASYSYIGWNQELNGEPTRFADKRVRQALTYLTNRAGIVEEIMLGYAEIAISPFSPGSKQHDLNLKPRPYDLDKAIELLKQAGYEDRDKDGVIEDANGEAFEFELTFFQNNEITKRIVLYLKDFYARAGIRLVPKPSEWPVMIDLITRRDFDAVTLGWTSGVETDIYQMLHSDQRADNGDNFVNYTNPELDRLIEQARATVDEKTRMPMWQKAESLIYEDQPYTFLMRRQSLTFIDKRIHNIEITRLGINAFLPMEWYVPSEMQKYAQ